MDKIKRNERLSAIARLLTDAPTRIHTLGEFCALFDAERQEIVLFVETKGTLPMRQYNRELKKYIPAYMLPQRMVTMEKLPHNANDKIDRVRLKATLAEENV